VNDAVDRLIVERQAMDSGLGTGFTISVVAHVLIAGGMLAATLLGPRQPLLRVQDGFAVALPPGGGGVRAAKPPAPAPPKPEPPAPNPAPPKMEPPPKVLKPPKEDRSKGLPEPDAKKSRKTEKAQPSTAPPRAAGVAGGTGTSSETPGLEFAPPGPGAPGGTDVLGDWYLAGIQRKIWLIWSQQIRSAAAQPATVSFTILADGSVTDVRLAQSSGVFLLDLAAQRAVSSAAPFGPLPKAYGTDRYTIQAVFKPAS
jgi:protein TonB